MRLRQSAPRDESGGTQESPVNGSEPQVSSPQTPWSAKFDWAIEPLKWPCAAVATLALFPLTWASVCLIGRILAAPLALIPFALGATCFVVFWRRWFRFSRWGKFLITLEHEATHALFALLTFHRIVGFRASLGRGGQIRFVGRGNWLITVAPYFFPTLALLLFLLAFCLPFPGLPWQSFLLGIALGYHCVSTIRETNGDQTDIQQLGHLFCWLFLPAANLTAISILLTVGHSGTEGLGLWTQDLKSFFTEIPGWLTSTASPAPTENLTSNSSLIP